MLNQDGERIEDKNINVLHVMANESFSEFAETLQKEIETETGVKFGVLQISFFSGMKYEEKIVTEKKVDNSDAQLIMNYMSDYGFVDDSGKPTEMAKKAVVEKTIELPKQLETAKESIKKAITENTAVKADDIIGKTYTETVIIEKEVS